MTTSAMKSPNHSPNQLSNQSLSNEARFMPNLDNYRTSLAYEGLELKKNADQNNIADLKRKYAR